MEPASYIGQPTAPAALQQATGGSILRWICKYAVARRYGGMLDGLDTKESVFPIYSLVLKPLQELITTGGRGTRRLRQVAKLELDQLLQAASAAGLAVLRSRLLAVLLRTRMTLIADLLCLNPGDDDVYSEFMRYFCSQAMEQLSARPEILEQELAAEASQFRDRMWTALAMDTEGQARLVVSGNLTREAESHRQKLLDDAHAVINTFVREGEGDVIEKIVNGGLDITSEIPMSQPASQLVRHCQRLRQLHLSREHEVRGGSGQDEAAVQLPPAAVAELFQLARAGEFLPLPESDGELPQPVKKRRLVMPQQELQSHRRASTSTGEASHFSTAADDGGAQSVEKFLPASENVESDPPIFVNAPASGAVNATRLRRSSHAKEQLPQPESQASIVQRYSCNSHQPREIGAAVATPRQPSTAAGVAAVGQREGVASSGRRSLLSSHGLLYVMLRERPRSIGQLLSLLRDHRINVDSASLAHAVRRLPLHLPAGLSSASCRLKRTISVSIAARVLLTSLGGAVPLKLSGLTSHLTATVSAAAAIGSGSEPPAFVASAAAPAAAIAAVSRIPASTIGNPGTASAADRQGCSGVSAEVATVSVGASADAPGAIKVANTVAQPTAQATFGSPRSTGQFGSACVTQWHYYSGKAETGGSAADLLTVSSLDVRRAAAANPDAAVSLPATGSPAIAAASSARASAVTSAGHYGSGTRASRQVVDSGHGQLPVLTHVSRPTRPDVPAKTRAVSARSLETGVAPPAWHRAASRATPSSAEDPATVAEAPRRSSEVVATDLWRQGGKIAAVPSHEQQCKITAFGRIGTAQVHDGQIVPGTARWVTDAEEISRKQRQADVLLAQQKDLQLLADDSVRRTVCRVLAAVGQQQQLACAAAEPSHPLLASCQQSDSSTAAGLPLADHRRPATTLVAETTGERPAATSKLRDLTSRCEDAVHDTAVAPGTSLLQPSATSCWSISASNTRRAERVIRDDTRSGCVEDHGAEVIVDSGSDQEDSLHHDRLPAPQAEQRSVRPPLPPIERHLRSGVIPAAEKAVPSSDNS